MVRRCFKIKIVFPGTGTTVRKIRRYAYNGDPYTGQVASLYWDNSLLMVRLYIHGSDTDTTKLLSVADNTLDYSQIHSRAWYGRDTDNAHGYKTVVTRMQHGCSRTWHGRQTDMTRTARMQCGYDTNMTRTTRMKHGHDTGVIRTRYGQGYRLRVRDPRIITRMGFL